MLLGDAGPLGAGDHLPREVQRDLTPAQPECSLGSRSSPPRVVEEGQRLLGDSPRGLRGGQRILELSLGPSHLRQRDEAHRILQVIWLLERCVLGQDRVRKLELASFQ